MARTAERASTPAPGGATLDVERQLWAMAGGLRGHFGAAGCWCSKRDRRETLLGEDRVYGGGLHKLEPKELANLPVGSLLDLLKLPVQRWAHPALA